VVPFSSLDATNSERKRTSCSQRMNPNGDDEMRNREKRNQKYETDNRERRL